MPLEADLFDVLKAVVPRVYPDLADPMPPRPFVTYQQVGGETVEYLDNAAPGLRNARVQVNVWAATRLEANTKARAIEDALRGAGAFQARPAGALVADYDVTTKVYGARQDFLIWHAT
jgi:hypothetical protein